MHRMNRWLHTLQLKSEPGAPIPSVLSMNLEQTDVNTELKLLSSRAVSTASVTRTHSVDSDAQDFQIKVTNTLAPIISTASRTQSIESDVEDVHTDSMNSLATTESEISVSSAQSVDSDASSDSQSSHRGKHSRDAELSPSTCRMKRHCLHGNRMDLASTDDEEQDTQVNLPRHNRISLPNEPLTFVQGTNSKRYVEGGGKTNAQIVADRYIKRFQQMLEEARMLPPAQVHNSLALLLKEMSSLHNGLDHSISVDVLSEQRLVHNIKSLNSMCKGMQQTSWYATIALSKSVSELHARTAKNGSGVWSATYDPSKFGFSRRTATNYISLNKLLTDYPLLQQLDWSNISSMQIDTFRHHSRVFHLFLKQLAPESLGPNSKLLRWVGGQNL